MPSVICGICGTKFYAKPSQRVLGWGKYCSIACRSKAQFKGKPMSCFVCARQTYKSLSQIKRSKSGNFFCSKKCQTLWRNKYFVGEKHANWQSGIGTYRNILKRSDILEKCNLCGIENRKILSVHHVDHNRSNNKISNLIWLCLNCHHLVHNDLDSHENLQNKLFKR